MDKGFEVDLGLVAELDDLDKVGDFALFDDGTFSVDVGDFVEDLGDFAEDIFNVKINCVSFAKWKTKKLK